MAVSDDDERLHLWLDRQRTAGDVHGDYSGGSQLGGSAESRHVGLLRIVVDGFIVLCTSVEKGVSSSKKVVNCNKVDFQMLTLNQLSIHDWLWMGRGKRDEQNGNYSPSAGMRHAIPAKFGTVVEGEVRTVFATS